ncbi:MAG: DNA helicase RecQ [Candidatus Aenigmarchaeota archaeon]|nr:DNA helicase RecQ [Candidatus Aenigmarchaeota archaeon]
MKTAHDVLKTYFGYSDFHPLQEAIITDILEGKDVFVLMPTGSGKSLCYQLPAVIKNGITIVISPLIALMKDQVDSLRANGIGASFINSALTPAEIEDVKTRMLENRDKILYIAPERLTSKDFLPFLKTLNISLFAIDEAHCISEWGHDFRPEYRKLNLLRQHFPSVPIVALTATAIPEVQRDIVHHLDLREPKMYRASFNRKNLLYYIRPKKDAYKEITDYLRKRPGISGIIYCQSRQTTDLLAEKLRSDGFRALPYHAGMPSDMRTEHQELFIRDDAEIIVATIAFGMGINKPNVRFVFHYDLPKNIESYYQETGRAGRDGLPSECVLFFSYGDKVKIEHFLEKMKNPGKRRIAYAKLQAMISFCERAECRRKMLLGYFGEVFNGECNTCDTCLQPPETFDGTEIAKKVFACIADSGQRFGTNYIISILTGKESRRSELYHHSSLKSYGAGTLHSSTQWHAFIRELVHRGCLDVAGDKYPVLKLNQRSMDILSGKATILLAKPAEKEQPLQVTRETQRTDIFDSALFEILRALRKKIADSENVPPYIVFPDITLKELATYYPQDTGGLRKIRGVGEIKLERYGNIFLEAVRNYCEKNEIKHIRTTAHKEVIYPMAYAPWTSEDDLRLQQEYSKGKNIRELSNIFRRNPGAIRSRLKKIGLIANFTHFQNEEMFNAKYSYSDTFKKTLELCMRRMTLEQIAASRNLATSTIATHIERLIMAGEDINIDSFVAKEKQTAIKDCMNRLKTQTLTPLKEQLGDNYSYDELRIARAKINADSSGKDDVNGT